MAVEGELGKREREILRAIVQDYIQTGEPVASHPLLARHEDLGWSSATVRSVMADLEEAGLIEKPHASAGRIPTAQGYRLFVDTLLKIRPPSAAERERIERVTAGPSPMPMLENAAELLHSLSHHAGVVTTPRPQSDPVRQIDFVRLRDARLLAILVSDAGIVTNKVVHLEFTLSDSELERAANFLSERLQTTPVSGLRERILADMRADETELKELIGKALRLAEQALPVAPAEGRVVVEGEETFLDAPEFADVAKARALLRAFAEKDRILRMLDKVLSAREVQIFIGSESDLAAVADVSVVAAPYARGGNVLGALAVVGPTRMNYGRVIPLVDLTARQISRALSQSLEP